MLHPSDQTTRRFDAVRDGRAAPVTCALCGCRLEYSMAAGGAWMHFNPLAGRDARGCIVACADAFHNAEGHPLN
jgi:hypothetical protein